MQADARHMHAQDQSTEAPNQVTCRRYSTRHQRSPAIYRLDTQQGHRAPTIVIADDDSPPMGPASCDNYPTMQRRDSIAGFDVTPPRALPVSGPDNRRAGMPSCPNVGALRDFLQTLAPSVTIDLADEPPTVVTDASGLYATHVVVHRGKTTAARALARLGVAGPFDPLAVISTSFKAPAALGDQPWGARLARVASNTAALTLGALASDMRSMGCQVIMERARHIYVTEGASAAADAAAQMATILSTQRDSHVSLYVCGRVLVTRDVALGMMTLGEGRADIDSVYACTASAIVDGGSAAIYERHH